MADIESLPNVSLQLLIEKDSAKPWTEPGLPDQSSRNKVTVSVVNGQVDVDYEVHLELLGPTAWFLDESDPDHRPSQMKISLSRMWNASVSIADSRPELVVMTARGVGLDDIRYIHLVFVQPYQIEKKGCCEQKKNPDNSSNGK